MSTLIPVAGNTAASLTPIPATAIAAAASIANTHAAQPTHDAAGNRFYDAQESALIAIEKTLEAAKAEDLKQATIAKGEEDAAKIGVTSTTSALEARVAALEERLENFNRRSGQRI